jgi:uncharacterized protein YciI
LAGDGDGAENGLFGHARGLVVSCRSHEAMETVDMEFFCYHRDRPGSVALRDELLEEHWSYMDRYATEMIARGPTFASDGETPTGSVHIIDLPDPAAGRAFAFDEPNYQAGVYRDVLLRRWRNTLERTMWDFPRRPDRWQPVPRARPQLGAGHRHGRTARPARADCVRPAAI